MKSLLLLTALSLLAPANVAQARDTTLHLPFDEVVKEAIASGKLDGSVKFHLAGKGPRGQVLDAEAITNKKTSGVGKSDEEACRWALMSALITLQGAAKKVGANAVSDIVSFYKRNEYKSSSDFECHAGGVMVGVALKARLVKI